MIPKLSKHRLRIGLISVLLLASIGCKDFEDCRTDCTSLFRLEFSKEIKCNTIKLQEGLRSFTAPPTSSFYLPLNPSTDSTIFIFHWAEPKTADAVAEADPIVRVDTLTIFYSRDLSLISPRCGPEVRYNLKDVQSTFPGTTEIVKPTLSRSSQQTNVQISF